MEDIFDKIATPSGADIFDRIAPPAPPPALLTSPTGAVQRVRDYATAKPSPDTASTPPPRFMSIDGERLMALIRSGELHAPAIPAGASARGGPDVPPFTSAEGERLLGLVRSGELRPMPTSAESRTATQPVSQPPPPPPRFASAQGAQLLDLVNKGELHPSPLPDHVQTGSDVFDEVHAQPVFDKEVSVEPTERTAIIPKLDTSVSTPVAAPTKDVLSHIPELYRTPEDDQRSHVLIDGPRQTGYVIRDHQVVESFPVSTAKHGIGTERGQTPYGLMEVSRIAGHGLPLGAVMKAGAAQYSDGHLRMAPIEEKPSTVEPLMTTRYVYIRGLEPQNKGVLDSGVRVHGTNKEGNLGTADSHGCIRIANSIIQRLADNVLSEGSKVLVEK